MSNLVFLKPKRNSSKASFRFCSNFTVSRRRSHTKSHVPHIETPSLPSHLDSLLDQPWTPAASMAIDKSLFYFEQEGF